MWKIELRNQCILERDLKAVWQLRVCLVDPGGNFTVMKISRVSYLKRKSFNATNLTETQLHKLIFTKIFTQSQIVTKAGKSLGFEVVETFGRKLVLFESVSGRYKVDADNFSVTFIDDLRWNCPSTNPSRKVRFKIKSCEVEFSW